MLELIAKSKTLTSLLEEYALMIEIEKHDYIIECIIEDLPKLFVLYDVKSRKVVKIDKQNVLKSYINLRKITNIYYKTTL